MTYSTFSGMGRCEASRGIANSHRKISISVLPGLAAKASSAAWRAACESPAWRRSRAWASKAAASPLGGGVVDGVGSTVTEGGVVGGASSVADTEVVLTGSGAGTVWMGTGAGAGVDRTGTGRGMSGICTGGMSAWIGASGNSTGAAGSVPRLPYHWTRKNNAASTTTTTVTMRTVMQPVRDFSRFMR